MSISNDDKVIARASLNAFGGVPNVLKYWDNNNESSIDILTSSNGYYDSIVPYSTIGLSKYSSGYVFDDKPLGVEIVGASNIEFENYPNVLATCAFNVINSNFRIHHGAVFKDVLSMYYPDFEVKHILFTTPFLWESLSTMSFADKKVTWLLAVPISISEYQYAMKNGVDSLELLFEEKNMNMFNLYRDSVI